MQSVSLDLHKQIKQTYLIEHKVQLKRLKQLRSSQEDLVEILLIESFLFPQKRNVQF